MQTIHPLRQLFCYTIPHCRTLILAIISSVLNKICDIVPEILIGVAIDIVVNQQHSVVAHITNIQNPIAQLYCIGALTALLWILESFFEYCYLILWRNLAQQIQHTLRLETYAHLQQLDMAYFENKTTGGLLTILNEDIKQLESFLSEGPNAIIQLIINIIVMGGIFFYISPMLGFLTLIPIPFVIGMAFFFQQKLSILYQNIRKKSAALSSHMASRLMGISTIKSYATQDYEVNRLAVESLALQYAHNQASRINAAFIPLVRMGILCGFITSLMVGGIYALQATIAISSYSILVFLSQRFLWPFTTLTSITDLYEQAMASLRRIISVLEQSSSIVSGPHQTNLHGSVTFDTICFSYPNGTPVFNDLSFTIPTNTTVAFVGTTGSGKSTVAKLLMRFYDAKSGTISLNSTNIKSVKLTDISKSIGLVSQDIYLVDDTIAHNIAYGSFNATMDSIIDAAKMSLAHDFIMKLPHGYNTHVGENGKNLSGGQRQRISIARAILKQPPIFIFDEATSALDNETETAIQKSLAMLTHKHTMIIIAHRLSTVRHADTIFVMEKGAIIECGTHNELLTKNGSYALLWKIQTGEIT